MNKILCYIYGEMADFEISLLLHRLRNTGGREIVAVSEDLEPLYAQSGLQYIPQMKTCCQYIMLAAGFSIKEKACAPLHMPFILLMLFPVRLLSI